MLECESEADSEDVYTSVNIVIRDGLLESHMGSSRPFSDRIEVMRSIQCSASERELIICDLRPTASLIHYEEVFK